MPGDAWGPSESALRNPTFQAPFGLCSGSKLLGISTAWIEQQAELMLFIMKITRGEDETTHLATFGHPNNHPG